RRPRRLEVVGLLARRLAQLTVHVSRLLLVLHGVERRRPAHRHDEDVAAAHHLEASHLADVDVRRVALAVTAADPRSSCHIAISSTRSRRSPRPARTGGPSARRSPAYAAPLSPSSSATKPRSTILNLRMSSTSPSSRLHLRSTPRISSRGSTQRSA